MNCEEIKTNKELLFVGFNQDSSLITVGTTHGYSIVSSQNGSVVFQSQCFGAVGISKIYFSSSLVSIVGHSRHIHLSSPTSQQQPPSNISIEHPPLSTTKEEEKETNQKLGTRTVAMVQGDSILAELNFITCVLNVCIGRRRMAVVLETKIHIFDVEGAFSRLHVLETQLNPHGICSLSSYDSGVLAFPSGPNQGDISLFDTLRLQPIGSPIHAHSSQISTLSLNSDGSLLATASTKGTVIRVFSVLTGLKICSFRRGRNPAQIFCLSFSQDSTLLAVTSDTGTVHVFHIAIPQQTQQQVQQIQQVSSLVTSPIMNPSSGNELTSTSSGGSTASHYSFWQLTPAVSEVLFENQRSFVSCKIPCSFTLAENQKYPISICAIDKENRLIIVTADGFIHQYFVGTVGKGELRHIKSLPLPF